MTPLRAFNKDRVGAALLILMGAAIVAQGLTYKMGELTRMGAGFIPVMLGIALMLVGIAISVTAEPGGFGTAQSRPSEWRGWLCVLGGVMAFAVLGALAGLVPATLLSVFIAAMGDRANSVRDSAILAVGVTGVGVLVFVYGLRMPFPLFILS